MKHNRIGLDVGSTTLKVVVLDDHDNICFSTYVRHNARIRETLSVVFSELGERFGDELFSLTITGSVGLGIAERTQIPFVQEVVASTAYVRRYHPQATTLIDIGGEDAKVVFLKGETPDMRMNSNCAGGTRPSGAAGRPHSSDCLAVRRFRQNGHPEPVGQKREPGGDRRFDFPRRGGADRRNAVAWLRHRGSGTFLRRAAGIPPVVA